jgi:hypothetical protein
MQPSGLKCIVLIILAFLKFQKLFSLQIYVVCSILLFSISKFNEEYDSVYRVYMLPYLLPLAHIGLTGSVYCTLSMTTERFLAVYYPFLRFR